MTGQDRPGAAIGASAVADAFAQDAAVVVAALGVDPDVGLSSDEAERRLQRTGPTAWSSAAGSPSPTSCARS